jgi:LAO/AO transport system kinase
VDLIEAALAGNRLALARLISQVENQTPTGKQMLEQLYPRTGKAHLIGITGAPGVGKSSLVNRLAHAYREYQGGKVGVIAVDPSSPFTGGALLGDRVRMRDVAGDEGVFIRSMATRGALGGLARATAEVALVLDGAGYETILIETVGAGQGEVDIARLAHTTLVVEVPGMGDDIQAIKAGILEIADILVVNKADLPGVEGVERALKAMLEMAPEVEKQGWKTPVLRTISTLNTGFAELVKTIQDHKHYLYQSGGWLRRERARLAAELESLIQTSLVARWRGQVSDEKVQEVVDRLCTRHISPKQAVDELLS